MKAGKMNYSKTFGKVIKYLEELVVSGDEIDYEEIGRIVVAPVALFQRIFVFISNVTIAEYVRKRRLTQAGLDLKKGNDSVIDIAFKYGFHSHSAFSRAFKEYHGITPSQAKQKNAKLNEYYPMNYLDMRYIGGKRIMAELKKIVYKEFEERLMVGVHNNTSFFEAGNAWKSYFESDKIYYLKSLSEFTYCEDIDENDGIGMMFNFQDTNTFELILGDFMRVNTPVPHDLYQKHIPSGTVACIQIEGNNIAEIVDSAFLLITEAIEKTDQEIDFEQFYWCEIYTKERYSLPLSRGEKVVIDYILPVKLKKDE